MMRDDRIAGLGRTLTVLSVEDDVLVAMGTTGTLEDLGHAVIEASSGEQALGLLATRPDIDLLVTDQGMPGMTGLQLAKAARGLRGGLPIVMVTGYTQLPDDEGMELVLLQKPFRIGELASAIREALDGEAAEGRQDARGKSATG